ncbi:MAG: sulfotransferase [Acidobacteria bacterium]|nr:sulfotransferase [Acidobacteriota bacterium]
MTLPNFLLIGAAKAGSTSIHEYLKQHPQIFMSARKEPNYFAFRGGVPVFRGPDEGAAPRAYEGLEHRLRVAKYAESITTDKEYLALFEDSNGQPARGESSVSNLYFPEAAPRIRETLDDVKLIAIFRNPVDRAFSKFCQFRRDGLEPLSDFGEAVDAEADRVRDGWSPTWYYIARGMYHEQLTRYTDRFPRDRMLLLLYDDFEVDPRATLRRIFGFLGVDDEFVPDLTERHNVSKRTEYAPRSRQLHRWLGNPKLTGGSGSRKRGIVARLRRAVADANTRELPSRHPGPLAPALRERLVEVFRQDVQSLGRLLGRDLSAWLRR